MRVLLVKISSISSESENVTLPLYVPFLPGRTADQLRIVGK